VTPLWERTIGHPNGSACRPYLTNIRVAGAERRPGTALLAVASGLLLLLAAAQGYVSWRAQFAFVAAAKHARLASGLEAVGLDTAAVIFALLGLAHARMGRPARVERTLNIGCALGSMVMNLLAANLGSPRSVAVYVLPPVLYAACSDRLIAVAGAAAGVPETSMWRAVGVAAPYALRFVLAPPSTARGLRQMALAAAPLPEVSPVGETVSASPDQVLESRPAFVADTLVAGSTQADGDEGAAQAAAAFAAELAAGKVPSIRRIRDQLGCGQARAVAVQQALRPEVTR
jgi:hypothetical protein